MSRRTAIRRPRARGGTLAILGVGIALLMLAPVGSLPADRATAPPVAGAGYERPLPIVPTGRSIDRPSAPMRPSSEAPIPNLSVTQTIVPWNGTILDGAQTEVSNGDPGAMALDPATGLLYVAGAPVGNVSVVNLSERRQVGLLDFPGASVSSLAYDPSDGVLYAAQPSLGEVTGVNLSGGSSPPPVDLAGASFVALDPNGSGLLVASSAGDTVAVADPSTGALWHTFGVGAGPSDIVRPPGYSDLFVTNEGGTNVSVLNLTTHASASVPIGSNAVPNALAYDSANGEIYVANTRSNNVTIVNPSTLRASRSLAIGGSNGESGEAIAFDAHDGTLYVGGTNESVNGGSPSLSLLGASNNTTFAVLNIQGGDFGVTALLVDPSDGDLYLTPWAEYGVLAVAPSRQTSVTLIGYSPSYDFADGATGQLYVGGTNEGTGPIDNESGVGNPVLATTGSGIVADAYSATQQLLYLANYNGAFWAINTTTGAVTGSVGGGYGQSGLAYDPLTNTVFVLCMNCNDITAFNATTLAKLSVIQFPGTWQNEILDGIAYDPDTQELFAGFAYGVAVINATTERFVGNLSLPQLSQTVTYDPGDSTIYVGQDVPAAIGDAGLYVPIDPTTLSVGRSIGLGGEGEFSWATYSPITGDLYSVTFENHSVMVVDPDEGRILQNVSIPKAAGGGAQWVSVDDRTGEVYAADPNTQVVYGIPTINGTPPSVSSFSASPGRLYANSTVSFAATVAGGTSPYQYRYWGLPASCPSEDVDPLDCVPTLPGNYTVHLEVTDAAGVGTNVTVSVRVDPQPQLHVRSFGAAPSAVDLGGTFRFQVSVVSTVSPLSYAYPVLPPGCRSADTATLTCTPNATGAFPVSVVVSGPANFSANASTAVTVYALPTISVVQLTPSHVDLHGSFSAAVQVTYGGTGAALLWNGLPPGCSPTEVLPTNITCTAGATGGYSISASLTDGQGAIVISSSATLTVAADPTVSTPSLSRPGLDLGQYVRIGVTTTAAVLTATNWSGLPTGCTAAPRALALNCTPTVAGSYAISVNVTDSTGYTVTSPSVLLTVAPALSVGVITADPSVDIVNSTFELEVPVSGGGGGVKVAWSGLPSGCRAIADSYNESCLVSAPGTFVVSVTAIDGYGATVTSARFSLEVTFIVGHPTPAPGGGSSPFLSGTTGLAVLGLLAALVVIAVAAVLWRRRSGRGPEGTSAPEPDEGTGTALPEAPADGSTDDPGPG